MSLFSTPPYLLFSTWLTVSHMNLDGSGYEVLVDSSSNVGPQAVDYHWRYVLASYCVGVILCIVLLEISARVLCFHWL